MKNTPKGLRVRVLAAAVACAGLAQAEEPLKGSSDAIQKPLVTDRPDFTESTEVVPAGHVQLEMGYTFTYDSDGKDRVLSHTAPELLLRISLSDRMELRIGWEGYTVEEDKFVGTTRGGRSVTREDSFDAASDLSLGMKMKLFEQDGWRPHLGFIAGVSLPSGSREVSSGDVDPGFVLLWAYDLSDELSVAGNVGVSVPTENAHRFVQASASLSLAVGLSDQWGAYVEYFGLYPNTDATHDAHFLNGGLTYLVHKDFQIDFRVGVGLNEEADDFFTGIGFSWRF